MRRSDFPSSFPPCFVSFAWRYHSSRLFSFLPKARRRPRDQELSVLAVPRRQLFKKWKRRDLPGSWRTQCAFAVFSDPGRTDASGLLDAPTRPPFRQRRRLQARGNFGAQSHGFSTGCLRLARWVSPPGRKTRFWVLAKLSQAGLNTRRIPTKGFNGASYIISPSPRLRLAQAASPFYFLYWVICTPNRPASRSRHSTM